MNKLSQTLSFSLAVLLHVALVMALLSKTDTHIKTMAMSPREPAPAKPIVEAVAINASELNKEIARLDDIEKQKEKKALEQQRALEKQKEAAVRARKQEEQRLAKLKQEQAQIRQAEAKKEKARLEEAQQAREKLAQEQEKIKKLQAQKQALEEEQKQLEAQRKKAQEEKEKQLAKARLEAERQAKEQAHRLLLERTQHHAMLIANKVMQNWRQPVGIDALQYKCLLSVKLSPAGEVLDAQVIESSGNMEFDRSSELAIRKASPLPLPDDGEVIKSFLKFNFLFDPEAT